MTRVAVLGTGIMGTGMAHSLRRAGIEVVVWNRTTARAQAVGEGTTVADNIVEAVHGCDAVITMLSDVAAVQDVARVFLDEIENALWIQCSTVGLDGTRDLSQLAEKHNVAYVECPVVGTKQPAEAGQLGVLAAGAPDLRPRVQPILEAIGKTVTWFDNYTDASATKLMMNNWVTGATALLAETLAFARANHLDPSAFLKQIKGGPTNMDYAQIKGAMMIDGSYKENVSFPLAHAAKDARLIADAAAIVDLTMPVNAAVVTSFEKVRAGHGGDDMAAVIEGLAPTTDLG